MVLDPDRTAREPWYSERRWSRYSPLMGVLAVALWIIAVIIQETANTPGEDTTREELVRYFNEDDNTIIAAGFIFMLGSAIFLWFLSTLRERFAAREGGLGRMSTIVFASGIVIAAMSMASFAPQVGGAFAGQDGGIDPASGEAYWNIGDGFFVAAIATLFVFYLASAFAILRTRILPAWLAYVSLLFAVAALVPWISWAVLIFGFPLWILVVSIWLFMKRDTDDAVVTRTEPPRATAL